MKLYKKYVSGSDVSFKKYHCLFGITCLTEEKSFFQKKVILFNKFVLKSKKYTSYNFYDSKFSSFKGYASDLANLVNHISKPVLLWIDQSLGGGTLSYSLNKFNEYKDDFLIIRLQYHHLYRAFVVSCPNGEMYTGFSLSFEDTKELLQKISYSKIVLNSLVAYRNISEVLAFIHRIREEKRTVSISYMVHDFFFICPNCNLMNSDNNFCGFNDGQNCAVCIEHNKSKQPDYENELFYGECENISLWRKMWEKSLLLDIDEVVCFSKSSTEIVNFYYPELSSKVVLIPHKIRPLRKVKVQEHDSINIAVLGKVDSIPKGKLFIESLSKAINQYNEKHLILSPIQKQNHEHPRDVFKQKLDIFESNAKNVNLFCLGDYVNAPSNMKVLGSYDRDNLPNIVEENSIDLIFIPSICAETFSYTTSEAIAMNVPVACFNLGGQADQVTVYSKGRILELSDSSDIVLDNILDFLRKLS